MPNTARSYGLEVSSRIDERLDPERVVADIASTGKPAFYEPTAADIVNRLKPLAQTGDVVVVFSNGGFDGIHQKLLDDL